MTYPMWNADKTGILVDNGQEGVSFLECGPEFESLKLSASDWSGHPVKSLSKEEIAVQLEQSRADMRCSPAQMRLALLAAGLLDQVQAIADGNPEASIVWEYATVITRNSPLIASLGGDNGFTPEEIDALLIAAMKVTT